MNDKIEKPTMLIFGNTDSPYEVPKIIEFIEELPLKKVGKVDKRLLRKSN